MNIITVSVTVLQYKCSFNDFKEVFVRDKFKKKRFSEKQYNFWGRACFGWVVRRTANKHFFKVGLGMRMN